VRDVLRASAATHRWLRDRLAGISLATIGIDIVCGVEEIDAADHRRA
jgi:hypothetical protein